MLPFKFAVVFTLATLACAQDYEYQSQQGVRPAPSRIQPGFSGQAQPKPTPVAILKQINRHNEDGSYTYGYEGGDGSFKIETKLPTGEVKGKYGYVDDTGKVRVVEYGATKYGFEPSGEGITVAPPTLVDETTSKDGSLLPEYAQYEEPQAPRAQPAPRPRPQQQSYESYSQPQYVPQRSAAPVPPRAQIPGAQPVRAFAPARPSPNFSFGNPAPIQEDNYEEPTQRPVPVTYAQPRPQYSQFAASPAATQAIQRPQPQPQQQPQYIPRPVSSGRASGGILDQLAKDYALPQGGSAPLHDISFGYY